MLESFKTRLSEDLRVGSSDRLLLAVSGGLDSMVMLHLLQQCSYDIAIAHIDHDTRQGQSTKDADFVKAYAERFDIPFFGHKLSKSDLAKGNFQANARAARYQYMQTILSEHGYHYICTAHHLDDKWETMFFALTRAAGLAGLTSLRQKDGNLLRPLLHCKRSDLEAYARKHRLSWKEDSSNATDHYDRNKIRHHITPVISKLFPKAVEQAVQSAKYLECDRHLIQELLSMHYRIKTDEAGQYYDMTAIRTLSTGSTLLYHLIKPLGFSLSDCEDIVSCSTTGAVFDADDFELLYDRDRLYMRPRQDAPDWQVAVGSVGVYQCGSRMVELSRVDSNYSGNLGDMGLMLRPWQAGDRLKPKGMQGQTKTVKALLSDLKYTRWQKEEVIILVSKSTVLSVVGVRDSLDLTSIGIKAKLA